MCAAVRHNSQRCFSLHTQAHLSSPTTCRVKEATSVTFAEQLYTPPSVALTAVKFRTAAAPGVATSGLNCGTLSQLKVVALAMSLPHRHWTTREAPSATFSGSGKPVMLRNAIKGQSSARSGGESELHSIAFTRISIFGRSCQRLPDELDAGWAAPTATAASSSKSRLILLRFDRSAVSLWFVVAHSLLASPASRLNSECG